MTITDLSHKRNSRKRFRGIASAIAAVVLAGSGTAAHAQFTGGTSGQAIVPAIGGEQGYTVTGGGVTVQGSKSNNKARAQIRPSVPAQQSFTTTLDYESWGNGKSDDVTRIRGDRETAVFGYTRGLANNSEVGVMVPAQYLQIDGLGSAYGIGDIMAAYRKYSFDAEDPDKPTFVYSLRAFLPTGDKDRGLGLGKFSVGPLLSVSKPLGDTTLGYAGASYTFVLGDEANINYKNLISAWAGGITQFQPRWGLQYELSAFNSVTNEKFVRVLVGPRYSLTPTRTLQLNFRQELKAVGKPRSISLGFFSQF